jgi:chromosome segregation ATPase
MKEIILKNMELESFKKMTGKWDFAKGKNVFLGENGTGKTTLCDAEHWLRTGKDSQDKAKFDIKTIVDGEPISKHSHCVSVVYIVDGQELTLERIYQEKWTKRRGRFEAEFDGHNTLYSINKKASTTKKEFDAKVQEVFGGRNFKLVSDPNYFAGLPWEQRREILTEIAGDVDKEKLIDSIEGLRESLDGLTIDEKNDAAKQRRRQINEDLKTLPARIDEHKKNIAQVTDGISEEEAAKVVAECRKAAANAKARVDNFKTDENDEIIDQIQAFNKKLRSVISLFEKEKTAAEVEFNKISARLRLVKGDIASKAALVSQKNEEIVGLRKNYISIANFEREIKENTCLFCGEVIVCGHCLGTDEDAEKLFNRNRAKELESINEQGRGLLEEEKKLKTELAKLEKDQKELEAIDPNPIIKQSENDKIKILKEKIIALENDKKPEKIPPELIEAWQKTADDLADALQALTMTKSNAASKERVGELETRMKNISIEFDRLEKFFFMFDQYNKEMAKQTEGKVNKLFDYVRFRMFTTQINGSVIPACDITDDDGRPYETALSGGERIRAGLDIIKTMSKHFQMSAPVFIDNAESLTTPIKLDCQTIELRASVEHKQLTQQ